MKESEKIKDKVKYLYYDKDYTMKEVADIVNRSRTRVSEILNEDPRHKQKLTQKRAKRVIQKELKMDKNSALLRIPTNMLNAIGVDEENNRIEICIKRKQIIIKSIEIT